MEEFTALDDDTFVPAFIATGIWLGIGAALDAYLVAKRRNRLITDVLRTKPGMVFLAVLCLHVLNVLGKADPFRAVAVVIQKRTAVTVAELSDSISVK